MKYLLPLILVHLLALHVNAQITMVFGSENASTTQRVDDASTSPTNEGEAGDGTVVNEFMGTVSGINNRLSSDSFLTAGANLTPSSSFFYGTLNTSSDTSAITFDIQFATSDSSDINDQRDGIGVHGGGANTSIDNNDDNSLLEWISFKLANVTGLSSDEQLVFTNVYSLFGTPDTASSNTPETYRLTSDFGVAPTIASQAVFANADSTGGQNEHGGSMGQHYTHAVDGTQFTFGAGSLVDGNGDAVNNRFVLNGLSIDVVPVPEANNFALLSSIAVISLLAVRRRI